MDDEEIIRNLARELLRELGHEVEVAVHGEEALVKYQAASNSGRPFDIVILDLTVRGGLGGTETLFQLQKFDPSVIAIVSSGYSGDAALADYGKFGFRACLKKPYNLDELNNTLHALLT